MLFHWTPNRQVTEASLKKLLNKHLKEPRQVINGDEIVLAPVGEDVIADFLPRPRWRRVCH